MFKSMRTLAIIAALLPLTALADMKPGAPTVLITGANRGIGFELARQYAEAGWNVIATSRRAADDPSLANLREVQAKHPQLVLERIDVTNTAMIRGVAEKYRNQPLDVLINNAAAVEPTFAADMAEASLPYDKIDFDDARTDFDVNALGPMRMVQAFMPLVEKSRQKKIANITSMAGSFGKPLPGALAMNYGASKAALNKYTVLLAIALKDKGVNVGLFQPVFVASKSDLGNMKNASPVTVEVKKLIKQIDALDAASSGKIRNFQTGEIDPF